MALRHYKARLGRKWGVCDNRAKFNANVAAIIARQRAVARLWLASIRNTAVDGRPFGEERRVAKTLVFSRTEWFSPFEWRIYVRSYFADDEAKPRRAPPSRANYYGTWTVTLLSVVVAVVYLLQRATVWGRRLTATWLYDASFAVFTEYFIVETLRVAFVYVILPWIIGCRLDESIHLKTFPFANAGAFPDSALAYLLHERPDLAESRLLRETTLDPATVLEDLQDHNRPRGLMRSAASLRATALITIVATGLVVPEVIQDTLFCEACDFLPVVAAMLDIDVLMTGGGGAGGRRKGGNLSAVLVSVGLLVLIALFVVALTILNRIEHHVIKISDETEIEVVADIIEATVTDSLQGLQRGLSRMSSSLNMVFFEEGNDEAKDDGAFKGIQRGSSRMSSTLKRSDSTTFFKTTDDDDDDGDEADDDGDAQTGARALDGDQELALQGDVTLVVRPDAAEGSRSGLRVVVVVGLVAVVVIIIGRFEEGRGGGSLEGGRHAAHASLDALEDAVVFGLVVAFFEEGRVEAGRHAA